jgi:DNA (cytosine-5)-methyltransferase 1
MIPIASFFTGGGFLDMGFEKAGFCPAFTNEFDDDISDMHDHAYTAWRRSLSLLAPEAKITYRGSIEDVKPTDLGGVRGIIGGPPCPAFSVAGKQGGKDDPRGKLSKCYIDLIIGARPEFFVMENVPGLARTAKHKAYLSELRTSLRAAGYFTDVKILNALEFGAPQDRERMFMVGFREDVLREKPTPNGFDPLEDGWFKYPKPIYPNAKKAYPWPDMCPFGATPLVPEVPMELTVNSAIADLDVHHDDPNFGSVPNSDEWFEPYSKKFTEVWEGDVHRKSYKRPHRYRYCPTAAYGNNEVHFHPWLARRMSVRECLRIQTLPDSYVLPAEKSLSIKFKMIGNGVPVKLAEALGASVMSFIKSQG